MTPFDRAVDMFAMLIVTWTIQGYVCDGHNVYEPKPPCIEYICIKPNTNEGIRARLWLDGQYKTEVFKRH